VLLKTCKELLKFKNKKMGKIFEQTSLYIEIAKKHVQRCPTSPVIVELQIKTMRQGYTSIGMAKFQKARCWRNADQQYVPFI
jgi:hypothetical protein